jgi:hypothetical protein
VNAEERGRGEQLREFHTEINCPTERGKFVRGLFGLRGYGNSPERCKREHVV